EKLRLAVGNHLRRLRDHLALDATAGDGAEEIIILVDNEMAADWAWRRPPGFHHGRKRKLAAFAAPLLGRGQHIITRLGVGHLISPLIFPARARSWRKSDRRFSWQCPLAAAVRVARSCRRPSLARYRQAWCPRARRTDSPRHSLW